MHRDVKLGLALGMLVIGFAAAFCFPRQPDGPATGLPLVQNAADPELDLQPLRPASTTALAEHNLESSAMAAAPVSDLPPAAATSPAAVEVAPWAASIAPLTTSLTPTIPYTASTRPSSPSSSQTPLGNRPPEPAGDEDPSLYVVQPGDMLSTIAQRKLGSSARFLDIFNANTDQLSNPGEIKPGMVLRIPKASSQSEHSDVLPLVENGFPLPAGVMGANDLNPEPQPLPVSPIPEPQLSREPTLAPQ